jgi:hypothetical protein
MIVIDIPVTCLVSHIDFSPFSVTVGTYTVNYISCDLLASTRSSQFYTPYEAEVLPVRSRFFFASMFWIKVTRWLVGCQEAWLPWRVVTEVVCRCKSARRACFKASQLDRDK